MKNKRFNLKQFSNDSTDTIDTDTVVDGVGGFGNEFDEEFRRGREYAKKGRSLPHHKNKMIQDAMRDGFRWQKRRM